jgi:hypothetical protein
MKLPVKEIAVAAFLGASASVSAVNLSLTPGTFGGMPADDPARLGALKASLTSADVQDQPELQFTARVDSMVYALDPNNPWSAAGGLTFWYRIANIDDGVTEGRPLLGLGIPLDFPTAAIEVNQDDSAPGAAPADIAGFNGAGNALVFEWIGDNTIKLAGTSAWVAMYTDYTDCMQGLVSVVDGTAEDIPALVPILVPEPTTYAGLFALGLAGFAAYRRFRG